MLLFCKERISEDAARIKKNKKRCYYKNHMNTCHYLVRCRLPPVSLCYTYNECKVAFVTIESVVSRFLTTSRTRGVFSAAFTPDVKTPTPAITLCTNISPRISQSAIKETAGVKPCVLSGFCCTFFSTSRFTLLMRCLHRGLKSINYSNVSN